jgi:hypothetical protein
MKIRDTFATALLLSLAFVGISTGHATILYQQGFNVDTANINDGTYSDFSLSASSGSVTGGILKLNSHGDFGITGYSGPLSISADIKAATYGNWHVGLFVGDHRFVFHPGYSVGAFRIEGSGGFGNQNMGYNPAIDIFHTMQIDWDPLTSFVTTSISGEDGSSYTNSWNAHSSFNPSTIGFTVANGGPAYFDNFIITDGQVQIPEPATMLLFGTGIAGLVGSRIRRKKTTAS